MLFALQKIMGESLSREKIRIRKSFVLLCFALPVFVGLASRCAWSKDEPQDLTVDMLSMGDFADHYQTPDGLSAAFDALAIRANLRVSKQWRLEIRHYRGTSPFVNGFQVSIGDFEGRVAHRLDNPNNSRLGDSPGQNVYGWVSWKIWTSRQLLNNVRLDPERDEGIGLGITRDALARGLSYWYSAGIYPSVRSSLAKQANAFTVETGGSYQLAGTLHFTLGYRFQSILTDTKHARGQEQGATISLQGVF